MPSSPDTLMPILLAQPIEVIPPNETEPTEPDFPELDLSGPDLSGPDLRSDDLRSDDLRSDDLRSDDLAPGSATFTPALSPQYPPPELQWIFPGAVPPDGLVTSSTISLTGLTPPSLWWAQHQFGDKTLRGWIAYPGTDTLPPRVDLVVNRQLWGLSDYLDRYSFVHHFGQSAQEFGYTIRVFNDVGDPLAIYPCPITPCSIILNSSGLGVFRGNDPFSNF